jgi:hypothetical protein
MIGAILLTLSDGGPDSRLQRLSQGLCDPSERSVLRHELVAFLTSAFLDHPQRETGRNEEVPARATEA